jgi:nickel/cobalt exporter
MPSFADLLQQGTANAWLFIPSAILLGALHGLEPGHSKTMMAAFIVAIRGTVTQAILLGLAATVSHTAVVWGIALGGMYLWQGVDAESVEPYLQLIAAVIIVAIALSILRRTWQDGSRSRDNDHRHHGHHHDHGAEERRIATPHGALLLELFEDGVPPRWRVRAEGGRVWHPQEIMLTTERPDGSRQGFSFVERSGFLESTEEIPEPHEFVVGLGVGRDGRFDDYSLSFAETHGHAHAPEGLVLGSSGHQDAHELEHAHDIRRRFADRNVTTVQIVLFGLTGGLIPCPAAVTILLLCLQLKHLALGTVLVLCFSIGLAITLVAVGVAAALGLQQAARRVSWFTPLMRRAPYLSSVLIIVVGLYAAWQGWHGLATHAA